jgi:hypothetical protein
MARQIILIRCFVDFFGENVGVGKRRFIPCVYLYCIGGIFWILSLILIEFQVPVIGALPLDACRNHDRKKDKYRFFRRFSNFSFIIIHKLV